MKKKFKIKSPYPLKNTISGTTPEGEIVSFQLDGNNQKGGSIPGMFAIPMGIYNRMSEANEKFNQRQLRQQQIKLNKEGFDSMEDKIASMQFELPQDNTGAIDTVVPRKKSNEPRKTTKGKGRNFRTVKEGAGMTKKGVAAYRRKNPGSKLKTAVTGKVKPGSKAAKRRKSFCARSKHWKGERGRAARRRWKC
jgi:hypothetical protein